MSESEAESQGVGVIVTVLVASETVEQCVYLGLKPGRLCRAGRYQ